MINKNKFIEYLILSGSCTCKIQRATIVRYVDSSVGDILLFSHLGHKKESKIANQTRRQTVNQQEGNEVPYACHDLS